VKRREKRKSLILKIENKRGKNVPTNINCLAII